MRVLFVDDEPRVLEGLANLLFDEAEDWDLLFAADGHRALAILDQEPVDVLVTDMRMPGMSGEELLDRVRVAHPSVVRIVLSGQTDREAAERCLHLVHDFLSKPCSAADLIATVASARAVAKSADTSGLRRMLGRLPGLPSEPGLYLRVRTMIDDGSDQAAIAAVLGRDMSITVQLMHVANSAFYGFRTPARTLAEAIPRLGLNAVSALVLAAETARSFDVADAASVADLNRHGHEVATSLARSGCSGPGLALAAAIHDIGRIIVNVCCPEESVEVERRTRCDPLLRQQIEREVLGFDHASAGGYLLRLWKIDPTVAQAVEFHHQPWQLDAEDPARPLALAIAVADAAPHRTGTRPDAPPWFWDLVDAHGEATAGG